ncbi:MAG: hypothetical protein K6T66_05495 [Peptococcaceae bacterium]|nr:hypothetical protein [Peptococcaceae bacterium]
MTISKWPYRKAALCGICDSGMEPPARICPKKIEIQAMALDQGGKRV